MADGTSIPPTSNDDQNLMAHHAKKSSPSFQRRAKLLVEVRDIRPENRMPGKSSLFGSAPILLRLTISHGKMRCNIERIHQFIDFVRFGRIPEKSGPDTLVDVALEGVGR